MSRKKVAIGVVVAALASVFVGVVWAQWLSTGEGTGRARATVAVEASVAPVDGEPDLYPGFTEGDVYFTITNDNPYEITFDTMSVTGVTSDTAGCPATAITVTPPAPGSLALVAPANTTTGTLSVADIVTMGADAPNECQGAAFDIALTLTGESSG